ncbi:MAG TPA: gamma-glutamylcyclotransferase [Bacillus sp. (in: firmicutes)]|nr:gamma-glutamylcyclotransferase [Bacillus sp. (in: firmicutes)]
MSIDHNICDKEFILLFVYGTLRYGQQNHFYLQNSTCIERHCWINSALFDTGLGYPAIKKSADNKTFGELYRVSKNLLKDIDELEDYYGPGKDNMYNRVREKVMTTHTSYDAFVYVIDPAKEHLLKTKIQDGDWNSYWK